MTAAPAAAQTPAGARSGLVRSALPSAALLVLLTITLTILLPSAVAAETARSGRSAPGQGAVPTEVTSQTSSAASTLASNEDRSRSRRGRPASPAQDPILAAEDAPRWGWWVAAAALLVLSMLVRRVIPRWTYPDDAEREEPLDLVRGVLLLAAVAGATAAIGLDLITLAPWLAVSTVGTLLVVSGAVHAERVRSVRRGVLIYVAALVLTLLHLVLDEAPGLRSPFGSYPDPRALLAYPPPASATLDVLTLRAAPEPVAILGLFALLALVAPLVRLLLDRGRWWFALGGSWGLYLLGLNTGLDLSPLGWESHWPALIWQVPFVHALALVYHRDDVAPLADVGIGALAIVAAGWGAMQMAALGPDPDPALLVVLVASVTLLALATSCWRPLSRGFGWALPAGRRPLLLSGLLVGAVTMASLV